MRRFFVDKIENEMSLKNEEHNHLSFVLRAKNGDEIILCNGDGFDYTAVIQSISKNETIVKIVRKEKNETEPQIKATLFFACLKGDKNDLVVQKATELGVYEIVPFISKNVSVKPESIKTERLNKIVLESCKQCGRAVIPKVKSPKNLTEITKSFKDFDTVLFLCEINQFCVSDIKTYINDKDLGEKIAVIIGSEGGFEEPEAKELICGGAVPLSLGKRILRAETAAIFAIGALMYEAGEMK